MSEATCISAEEISWRSGAVLQMCHTTINPFLHKNYNLHLMNVEQLA